MRFSQILIPTQKEDPKDAEIASHKLMLRAGMIQKLASGIYSFLPLGLRALRKLEAIVREEMNRIFAQEVLMPAVIPGELWQQTGRWDAYGDQLLKFKDRLGRDYCFGPTHEEVITDLAKTHLKSYKQLPATFYQIQTKFRDELRPRFGLMRGREFLMKDAYSFHADEETLEAVYQAMDGAYRRIFERCGLSFKRVAADSGAIGGNESAEFMVTAASGEDEIFECDACSFAANVEAAPTSVDTSNIQGTRTFSEVATPGKKTIDDVASHLGKDPRELLKSLIYIADETPILILLRGHHELNEIKLAKLLNAAKLLKAEPAQIVAISGVKPGSVGPINLQKPCRILVDHSVGLSEPFVVGANREGFHLEQFVLARDLAEKFQIADLRNATSGDACPQCLKGRLRSVRGIEVGHIFKLGYKYSEAMSAKYLGQDGVLRPYLMGCYGIGVSRTLAATVEQHHDEKGMKWPLALAPFQVVLILTSTREDDLKEAAECCYADLVKSGVDVLFDDRDQSVGVKFKDAELLGVPLQLVVGKSFKTDKMIEIRNRWSGDSQVVAFDHVSEWVKEFLNGH